MNPFAEFFASPGQPALKQLLLVGVPLLAVWLTENGVLDSLYRLITDPGKKAFIAHKTLALVSIKILVYSLAAFSLVVLCSWCHRHQFGIVYWLKLPAWSILALGIVCIDFFGDWLVHFARYKWPSLGGSRLIENARFKSDQSLNPGQDYPEKLLQFGLLMVAILLMGIPVYAILFAKVFFQVVRLLSQTDLDLPQAFTRRLNLILASRELEDNQSGLSLVYPGFNFGTQFNVWDRLFGTHIIPVTIIEEEKAGPALELVRPRVEQHPFFEPAVMAEKETSLEPFPPSPKNAELTHDEEFIRLLESPFGTLKRTEPRQGKDRRLATAPVSRKT